MTMNITHSRLPLSRLERFSPAVAGLIFLAPLLLATAVAFLFGVAWGIAVLMVVAWSDLILRLAETNFRGLRKKDKVMAPLVHKSFSSHTPDPHLGWGLKPGHTATNSFTIPRLKLSLDYTVTTDDQGRRITSPEPQTGNTAISFYGCSNTFGWGLDDEATFPWLVQADHPEFTIRNYGVSGYSLCQILLRMEQTIAQDRPKVVVLGFSPGLEARSVSDHHYLRIVGEQGGTPPSCLSVERKNGKRTMKRFPLEGYKHLPLSGKSPLIKLVERSLNRLVYASRAKNAARRKTTEHLLLAMDNLCKKHGAVFHVQYLVANTGYRKFLRDTNINWAPGPADLDACDENGTYRYRLSPFDGHPNAQANKEYANALRPVLASLLDSGRYKPEPGAMGTGKRDEATETAIYPVF